MEKNNVVVDLNIVRVQGVQAGVALAIVKETREPMTNTQLAKTMGITFPTAQKILAQLAQAGLIKADGKKYVKI